MILGILSFPPVSRMMIKKGRGTRKGTVDVKRDRGREKGLWTRKGTVDAKRDRGRK